MFSKFEWMMAIRYLRARRQEGFISVIAWFSLLGIALGVATLIIVMSVMNGFRAELLGRVLGLNGHVTVYSTSPTLSDFDTLAEKVAKLPGVKEATPIVEGQVMATGRGEAKGALVRGIRQDDLKVRQIMINGLRGGSYQDLKGNSVAVGARLARSLGLWVGDKITLISPKGNVTAFGTVPRMRAYKIAAVFDVGMYEYDSTFVYMPLPTAQKYFKTPGAVTYLEVMVDEPFKAPEMTVDIYQSAGGNVRVFDWQQTNKSFFDALQVERNVMFLILSLIIMVAAFNIISSLIMLVKDKGKDIAILRTMGATRGMIMRVFLISGASVGFIGTISGFVLGLAFCLNIETIRQALQSITGTDLFSAEIYFLSHLPAKVDSGEVISVLAMALGLSFLATLYPSWRAARIDPVEALRYE